MSMDVATRPKRDTLNLRISPTDRMLIDGAAELSGKTRTDFVLDAARRAAEDAFLERTLFLISPEGHEKLVELLDAPPRPNERLRRLIATSPPWEE